MADARGWFEGVVPRNAREDRFVERLRSHAEDGVFRDVEPTQSWAMAVLEPLYLEVTIPGWHPDRDRRIALQIGFWTTPNYGDVCLEGCWGDEYLLDDHYPDDADCLTVLGIERDPEACADVAADWLHTQLGREIELREWCNRKGREVASVWRLGGSDRHLMSQGSFLRTMLTKPTHVRRIR